jgi:hypothetical protein
VYDHAAPNGRRWIGTFDTEAEARAAERAATVGLTASVRARTVADWATVWERDYARPAPATRRTYASALRRIVKDAGELRLDRVDRPTARRFAKAWPRARRASPAPCSQTRIATA